MAGAVMRRLRALAAVSFEARRAGRVLVVCPGDFEFLRLVNEDDRLNSLLEAEIAANVEKAGMDLRAFLILAPLQIRGDASVAPVPVLHGSAGGRVALGDVGEVE